LTALDWLKRRFSERFIGEHFVLSHYIVAAGTKSFI
jgi:hypothetical protein